MQRRHYTACPLLHISSRLRWHFILFRFGIWSVLGSIQSWVSNLTLAFWLLVVGRWAIKVFRWKIKWAFTIDRPNLWIHDKLISCDLLFDHFYCIIQIGWTKNNELGSKNKEINSKLAGIWTGFLWQFDKIGKASALGSLSYCQLYALNELPTILVIIKKTTASFIHISTIKSLNEICSASKCSKSSSNEGNKYRNNNNDDHDDGGSGTRRLHQ